SPRKAQFSLYVYSETEKSKGYLKDLGKYKMGKACIYMKRLSDINVEIVKKLSMETLAYLEEHHECACRK
ncbi:MAG: DUF1801 domain-containing protein, partial [Croceitalea sp.]|nr:DUF1801 domain-containing protein [Croceitalea sp.]